MLDAAAKKSTAMQLKMSDIAADKVSIGWVAAYFRGTVQASDYFLYGTGAFQRRVDEHRLQVAWENPTGGPFEDSPKERIMSAAQNNVFSAKLRQRRQVGAGCPQSVVRFRLAALDQRHK